MRPDYKDNDPRGWCGDPGRGAALGRPGLRCTPASRLYLRRVRVDQGGYDALGTYWGIGAPLWWCADDDGEVDFVLRAADRARAKDIVREQYPDARFWR